MGERLILGLNQIREAARERVVRLREDLKLDLLTLRRGGVSFQKLELEQVERGANLSGAGAALDFLIDSTFRTAVHPQSPELEQPDLQYDLYLTLMYLAEVHGTDLTRILLSAFSPGEIHNYITVYGEPFYGDSADFLHFELPNLAESER